LASFLFFRMHKPRSLLPVPPILKNAEALSSFASLWLPWGGLDQAQAKNNVSFRCGATKKGPDAWERPGPIL